MEVRVASQGRQGALDLNNNLDNTAQINNTNIVENLNGIDNRDIENKKLTEKDLKKAIDKLNKFLEDNKTHAEYQFHDKFTNDLMVKIVDDKGKVIQEIPPKKILDMVAKMCEMVGVLFDKKA
ncbi:FlaG protein [Clostridiales bacterium oral taxon 876 str. F0540]|nr:FlaG protein [Clostridiales bacterium oral taxon 876 str. F0540]